MRRSPIPAADKNAKARCSGKGQGPGIDLAVKSETPAATKKTTSPRLLVHPESDVLQVLGEELDRVLAPLVLPGELPDPPELFPDRLDAVGR
jgi:hypothetical protein